MTQSLSRALILTSPLGACALDEAAVDIVRPHLAGRTVFQEWWLGPGEAWEALFVATEDEDLAPLQAALALALAPRPVDVNIIPDDITYRRKKLLVADMDSTIIQQECIDEMADVLGLKPKIAAITERAMRGELKFEDALTERLALLAGISEDQLARVYEDRIRLMPGARTLLATMKKHGAFTVLVSGGFTFFTSRVAAAAGFDTHHANTLEIVDGKLTGRAVPPILGREAKLSALQRYTRERNLVRQLTLAVGDGANDLAMIKAAGLGVAYRAKPIVAAEADARIAHAELTALLYLQGYRRDEFVGG